MHRRLLLPDAAIAPAHSAYVGPGRSNLETNMAIILGVLLCSLISALGLNSLVRCALRCSRRFSQGRPDHSPDRAVAPSGLKKRELRQIPVVAYGPGANIAATECPICLAEFVEGDRIRVLPKCRHGFHMRCIDTWLLSHSSCPNCRHELLDKTEGSGSGSDSCRSVPDGRRVTGTGLGPPE